MVEEIIHNGQVMAIIIRHTYQKDGISFLTPNDFSQQMAYMQHSKGKIMDAHVHNKIVREVQQTKEFLYLRKGKLRVDLYDNSQKYLESKILQKGDVLLLVNGGHGFEVLEDIEMVEVKQGPYAGDRDKTRFQGVSSSDIVVKQ